MLDYTILPIPSFGCLVAGLSCGMIISNNWAYHSRFHLADTNRYRFTAYKVEFSRDALRHLRGFSAADRSIIIQSIESNLLHEPLIETRNRKRMRPNPLASWELRVGKLRIFYEARSDAPNQVHVLAIGWKDGNRLFIDGEEIVL